MNYKKLLGVNPFGSTRLELTKDSWGNGHFQILGIPPKHVLRYKNIGIVEHAQPMAELVSNNHTFTYTDCKGLWKDKDYTCYKFLAGSEESIWLQFQYVQFFYTRYPNCRFLARDNATLIQVWSGDKQVGVVMPVRFMTNAKLLGVV